MTDVIRTLIYLVTFIVILLGVFSAFRILVLWHWNLDKLKSHQRQLAELCQKQLALQNELLEATLATNALLQRMNRPHTSLLEKPCDSTCSLAEFSAQSRSLGLID